MRTFNINFKFCYIIKKIFCSSVDITRNSFSKPGSSCLCDLPLKYLWHCSCVCKRKILASYSGKIQTQKILLAELAAKSNDIFLAFCYTGDAKKIIILFKVILYLA